WIKYENAFSGEYRTLQSVEACVRDILAIEYLNSENSLKILIDSRARAESCDFSVVVHSLNAGLTISQAAPILENIGLEVVNAYAFEIAPRSSGRVYMHRFDVLRKEDREVRGENHNNL